MVQIPFRAWNFFRSFFPVVSYGCIRIIMYTCVDLSHFSMNTNGNLIILSFTYLQIFSIYFNTSPFLSRIVLIFQADLHKVLNSSNLNYFRFFFFFLIKVSINQSIYLSVSRGRKLIVPKKLCDHNKISSVNWGSQSSEGDFNLYSLL